jgi:hypothetical protein
MSPMRGWAPGGTPARGTRGLGAGGGSVRRRDWGEAPMEGWGGTAGQGWSRRRNGASSAGDGCGVGRAAPAAISRRLEVGVGRAVRAGEGGVGELIFGIKFLRVCGR